MLDIIQMPVNRQAGTAHIQYINYSPFSSFSPPPGCTYPISLLSMYHGLINYIGSKKCRHLKIPSSGSRYPTPPPPSLCEYCKYCTCTNTVCHGGRRGGYQTNKHLPQSPLIAQLFLDDDILLWCLYFH